MNKHLGAHMNLLPAIIHETTPKPDAAVIWLHGLGADGHDFAPIVPQLKLPNDMGIRFIFPHAPHIPVTVNGGYVMPAWYDILEIKIDRGIDSTQLLISAEAICRFLDSQIESGIDSRRIIVAGFSQGGAVAYQASLSFPKPLGGLLAMSTYLATRDTINLHEANNRIPIEIHHGSFDPVVPEPLGQKAQEFLTAKGYNVRYRSYPMEHSVCPQQIDDISSWLQKLLS
jgi:phospholipase/carboxylesterase